MTFVKGRSGNPGGRGTEKVWRDAIRRAVARREPLDPSEKPQRLDLLAEAAVKAGLSEDVAALKEIGDRLDGKVPQAITGDSEGDPLVINIVKAGSE